MTRRVAFLTALICALLAQTSALALADCKGQLRYKDGPSNAFLVVRGFLTASQCSGNDMRRKFLENARDLYDVPGDTTAVDGTLHYIETYRGRPATCISHQYTRYDFDRVIWGYENYVYRYLKANPGSPQPPLVLYLHGGLVAGVSGFQSAAGRLCDFLAPYRCDEYGARATPPPPPEPMPTPKAETMVGYPVFVIWNSGASQALAGSMWRSRSREATAHGIFSRGPINAEMIPTIDTHNGKFCDVQVNELNWRLGDFLSVPNLWHFMEDEISDSFELNSDPAHPSEATLLNDDNIANSDRVGLWLVQAIAKLSQDYHGRFHVVLVGHSMGSEYASWLVEAYDRYVHDTGIPTDDPRAKLKFDTIFMAPAVPYAVFERAIRTNRIAHFRLFSMYDDRERSDDLTSFGFADGITGPLYPISLLYFISGVLNPVPDYPILGLQRYWLPLYPDYAKNPLVRDVHAWIGNRTVWSPTLASNPKGSRVNACRHGNFNGDPEMVASIVHIVNHGFDTPAPSPPPTSAPPVGANCFPSPTPSATPSR